MTSSTDTSAAVDDLYYPECPTCEGRGHSNEHPDCCPCCGGRGYIEASRKKAAEYAARQAISDPAAARDGQTGEE